MIHNNDDYLIVITIECLHLVFTIVEYTLQIQKYEFSGTVLLARDYFLIDDSNRIK